MCGIAGYLGHGNEALIDTMIQHIRHRGPDAAGKWLRKDCTVGFGHTRLAIQDLSDAGSQPMISSDKNLTLCYNGELYGHDTHRKELEASGHRFKGSSDTEVLVEMYQRQGVSVLEHLNGMFAFAVCDEAAQSLLLARDAMGVKPLYYGWSNGTLLFSSEIKPILAARQQPVEPCPIAMEAFLQFLYVPGPRTLFEGIFKLEPGTYLKVTAKNGQIHKISKEIVRWYTPRYTPSTKLDERELVGRIRDTLNSAVKRQLVSDVPVGAFLSGGIDSSALVALASQHASENSFQCFAATYPEEDVKREGGFGDLPYAKAVAKRYSVPLHVTEVTPKSLDLLPRIVDILEEPDADLTALVTYLLCDSASQSGSTVLLSGTGGDEVFHGYRTHLAYRQFARAPAPLDKMASQAMKVTAFLSGKLTSAQSNLTRRASRMSRALPLRGAERHLAIVNSTQGLAVSLATLCKEDFFESLPNSSYLLDNFKTYSDVAAEASEAHLHSWNLTQSFLSDHNFMYTDRCSMSKSLEVRVPFMDKELMDLCYRIPAGLHTKGGRTKHLLKSAVADVLPSNVINRPKMGFNPPVRTWIAEEQNALSRELLDAQTINQRGLFASEAVERLKTLTRTGKLDGAQLMFAIQYLELWFQRFVDRPITN